MLDYLLMSDVPSKLAWGYLMICTIVISPFLLYAAYCWDESRRTRHWRRRR